MTPRTALAMGGMLILFSTPALAAGSSEVKKLFADPPREYASAPLWVWNDLLTDEEILGTMRDLAGQKVKQVFVHPRPGLMTPYLSPEWFRLWKLALAEAERLDMNVWIYDENSYPSGFAGGFVPDAMPESRGRGLALNEVQGAPKVEGGTIAVFALSSEGYEDVTAKARAGEPLAAARHLVASVIRAGDSPWHGGKCYVDILYPGVTEKFLDITLDAYKREIGGQFGKRVPGIFTDEPQILPAGGLPWTDDLPREFEKRRGYRLTDRLPGLVRPLGDYKRLRHDYYRTLLELFIERWGKPYHDRCERYGLEFTGHYWEHEWPNCLIVPDNMALYAWHQRPAIDILMNQYGEGTHAQFGNARAVRELSSVANQIGARRTLCEAYGAGGWDLRFEDMKRIADWLFVLGVNTLDEHLSYITLRGARKKDHPQSFSYHEPWWDSYHARASYDSRLSAALSQGEQLNPFLLIEPTSTAWMYQADPSQRGRLDEIGDRFQKLLLDLEKAQVEYDIGCEDIIARQGSVESGDFRIGKRGYSAVVIPPLTETLMSKTWSLLEAFLEAGGTVLCSGESPALADGRPSDSGASLAADAGWKTVEAGEVPGALLGLANDGFAVRRPPLDKGILFHHRRRLDDGDLLFLVNSSRESPSSGTVESGARGVERWDPETGTAAPYPFRARGPRVEARFDLPPSGSLLLFLSKEKREGFQDRPAKVAAIEPAAPPEVRRLEPNVLTLDYVDVEAGGSSLKGSYVYPAAQFAFQKNGMERNPWDSAVQFKDEFLTRKFPEGSGFTAAYRFTIEEKVPEALFAVMERPDLYAIALNGTPLKAEAGSWWLDKAFGKIDIRSAAKVGENSLTLKASPFTVLHEIEAAYILGDFCLKAVERGFAIVPARKLELGPWNAQGHPFYATGFSYTEKFWVPGSQGKFRVSLPGWYGSVAKVSVNGKPAGVIECPPWERDVTGLIRAGENTVDVVVVGTLKNTLGPHHAGPGLGSAWPGMFHQGPKDGPPPGERYATVGYGLLKPFVLMEER